MINWWFVVWNMSLLVIFHTFCDDDPRWRSYFHTSCLTTKHSSTWSFFLGKIVSFYINPHEFLSISHEKSMNNPHVFDVAQQCLAQVTGVIIGSRRRLSWLWTPSCLHSVSRMIRPKHLPSGNHPWNTNVNYIIPLLGEYPLVNKHFANLNMFIDIVSFPINSMVIFHSFWYVYQRVA